MLKCGQKDNKNYTFGIRKEQMRELKVSANKFYCKKCHSEITEDMGYCPLCAIEDNNENT